MEITLGKTICKNASQITIGLQFTLKRPCSKTSKCFGVAEGAELHLGRSDVKRGDFSADLDRRFLSLARWSKRRTLPAEARPSASA